MIEDDDTAPTPERSQIIGTGTAPSESALFRYHGELLDAAIRNTMAMTGSMAQVMRVAAMNPWYRAWKAQVDDAFQYWHMPSPAGVYYDYGKTMLDQQIGFLPPGMREWMKFQLMYNPSMQQMMHGDGVISVLEYIGEMLPGAGELHGEKYNHRLLTENSKGEIVPIDVKKIDALFPRSDGKGQERFPHIILTSSHAKGEKLSDVTDITHGIEALARDSNGGVPFKVAHINGDVSKDPDNTLIIMACDTQRNPFLNAAALLRRLSDLRRIEQSGEADDFNNASPGAKRLAKLILRCMAQNPEDVDINDLSPLGAPLQLRARPELIAQHFQLIGYSKGGNVVSDAMRYLVSDLSAVDADGKSLVQMQGQDATQDSIRNLVRNIACMSIAALEVPMAEHYKQHGVRRISFNNKHDMISNHMDFESSWADHKWAIEGVTQNQGHDPKDAMGTRDGRKGYILQEKSDEERRVVRRIKESFAPLYGKAAISSISFTDDDFTGDAERLKDSVLIGTAAGTSDALFASHVPTIIDTLSAAFRTAYAGSEGDAQGLTAEDADKIMIREVNTGNRRAFVLEGPEGWRESPKALQALYDGFKQLRDTQGSGLVVSDDIFERIIPERVRHMQNSRDGYAWKSFTLDTGISRSAA